MHKMGPHCASCKYKRQAKTEDDACPFNSLYWHFHAETGLARARNPRIGMVYRTWDKMQPAQQQALLDRGDVVLANLENFDMSTSRTLTGSGTTCDSRRQSGPAEALHSDEVVPVVLDDRLWSEDRWDM